MKFVKPFSKTCYSENLVLDPSPVTDKEMEDGNLVEWRERRRRKRARVSEWIGLEVQVFRRPKVVRGTPMPGHRTHTTQGFERKSVLGDDN
jgi:hypothetical protein